MWNLRQSYANHLHEAVSTLQKTVLPRLHDPRRSHRRPHGDALPSLRQTHRLAKNHLSIRRLGRPPQIPCCLHRLSYTQVCPHRRINRHQPAYGCLPRPHSGGATHHQVIHAKAWLNAGWEVQDVNFKEGTVTFKKVRKLPRQPKKKKLEITQALHTCTSTSIAV